MSLVPKTATIQLRVVPVVKRGSEKVLRHIGLTMSQAVELFLRRIILDQRLPFEVVALEAFQMSELQGLQLRGGDLLGATDRQQVIETQEAAERKKGERPKKNLKSFLALARHPESGHKTG